MTTMQHLSYSCDGGSFFCGGLAVRSSGSAWCTHPSALQSWTGGCESFERLMSKTLLGAEVGLSSHRLRPQQANNQAFSPSFLTLVEDRDVGFTISAQAINVVNRSIANSTSSFFICLSVLPMLYPIVERPRLRGKASSFSLRWGRHSIFSASNPRSNQIAPGLTPIEILPSIPQSESYQTA